MDAVHPPDLELCGCASLKLSPVPYQGERNRTRKEAQLVMCLQYQFGDLSLSPRTYDKEAFVMAETHGPRVLKVKTLRNPDA